MNWVFIHCYQPSVFGTGNRVDQNCSEAAEHSTACAPADSTKLRLIYIRCLTTRASLGCVKMKSAYVFAAIFGLLLVSSAVKAAQDEEEHDDGEHNEEQTDVNENSSLVDEDDDYNPRELLLSAIQQKAHPKVPPPPQYLPVQVQVKLRPLHIDEVCTKTYHVKMPILESYNWTDPRLAWNESDFGGIKTTSVEATDIWMPDIVVYQNPDNSATSLRPKQYRPIVFSDGTVLYMPRTEYVIACAARSWSNVTEAENNNSTADGATNSTQAVNNGTASANETGVFACEFDQGPWTYDTTIVDIIPTLAGSGLATTKGDKKVITRTSQRQQQRSENSDRKPQQQQQQRKQQQQKLRQRQRFNATTREYTQNDYNATADLSWFESNQLYDVKSFEAKRAVMHYPAMGTEMLWASMHYRLVVHVKESNKQADGFNSSGAKYSNGAAAPVAVPVVV